MSVKIKNIVITGMLVLITIPFLLLTDIFPFLRFGMFAEPVKTQSMLEVFEVSYIEQTTPEQTLDPESVGIEPHFFQYIARNYYYRNEAEKFLDNLSTIARNKKASEWRMKKILIPASGKADPDTLIVFRKRL